MYKSLNFSEWHSQENQTVQKTSPLSTCICVCMCIVCTCICSIYVSLLIHIYLYIERERLEKAQDNSVSPPFYGVASFINVKCDYILCHVIIG